MKTRTLTCFGGFRCIAGACKDSCCIGWEIDVDEDSYQRFQKLSGPFGDRLRASILTEADGTHHYILKEGDRCPFLNEHGLCDQILECGEDILCEICAQHPRFFSMAGETQEWGVGLACPEAARLLLAEDAFSLTEEPEATGDEFLDFLLEVRRLMLETAQSEGTIYERMGMLLDIAEKAQEQLDWEDYDTESLLPEEPAFLLSAGQAGSWLDALTELEPIDEEWSETLADALAAAQYPELMEEFAVEMEEEPEFYARFLVYLLFRYGLKAYEDHDLLYWVRAAVWSVLTAEMLAFGRWLKNHQRFDTADREDILRIFSKEVEYDPDIIEGLDPLLEGLENGEAWSM